MGLDMFLDTYKKFEDTTPKQAQDIGYYYQYLEKKNNNDFIYSFEEYYGRNRPEITNRQLKFYLSEYKMRYFSDDETKSYGHYSVTQNVAYWRKANAIHSWFITNVGNGIDDCEPFVVTKENLEELLDLCRKVIENPKKCAKLLPTEDGFFFGDTEYNEYYFNSVKYTIATLERLISETDFENEVMFYQASW